MLLFLCLLHVSDVLKPYIKYVHAYVTYVKPFYIVSSSYNICTAAVLCVSSSTVNVFLPDPETNRKPFSDTIVLRN